MNWDMIEGNWKQFQGHVKQKWGRLTDDNLDRIAGKRDQLCEQIQESYGITKDQAERWLKAFEKAQEHFQAESGGAGRATLPIAQKATGRTPS